jgi:hypothetical protein
VRGRRALRAARIALAVDALGVRELLGAALGGDARARAMVPPELRSLLG